MPLKLKMGVCQQLLRKPPILFEPIRPYCIKMNSDYINLHTIAIDNSGLVTFWQLYERAARATFGEDILVKNTLYFTRKAQDINFAVSIVSKEIEPREVTRTVLDIVIKEYANGGKEGQDQTILKASKGSLIPTQKRYNFFTSTGLDFGFGDNIATQIMSLSVSGGTALYNKSVTEEAKVSNVVTAAFIYEQEEQITVPPGKGVKAKITSYSVKYEMNYTLKFSVYRNVTVPVSYQTKCQRCCFGFCSSTGSVLVSDMISVLPNYNGNDENGRASFTQTGTLSWVGEAYNVNKVEDLELAVV